MGGLNSAFHDEPLGGSDKKIFTEGLCALGEENKNGVCGSEGGFMPQAVHLPSLSLTHTWWERFFFSKLSDCAPIINVSSIKKYVV